MATVEPYSLANGQRRYRVRYRTPDRRGTDKKGFQTKREAQAFAATIEVSMMRGEYVAPSAGRITVAELADRYLSLAHVKATTDLRHTASLAISTGANPKSVQTMLGHRSAAMTLDTYADLFPDDLDAVAARLDEARARSVGGMWARDAERPPG